MGSHKERLGAPARIIDNKTKLTVKSNSKEMRINPIRNLSSFAILIGGLTFGSYLYATPYLSILNFKSSIDRKDITTASKYINFPSVRKSLKIQLNDALKERAQRKIIDTPLGVIKLIALKPILNVMVSTTVNATVTPYGMELLLRKGKLSKGDNKETESNEPNESIQGEIKNEPTMLSLYYKGVNTFVLQSKLENSKSPLKAYWQRAGLFHWRLEAVDLPKDLLLI